MIAEAGLAALWLGAALCALQLFAAAVAVRGESELAAIVRPVAVAQALLTTTAGRSNAHHGRQPITEQAADAPQEALD